MKPGPARASRVPAERFALPSVPPKQPPLRGRSRRELATERAQTRILVVEDDFLIGLQTVAALGDAGFNVIGTATTAEEAIALAKAHRPSLAVMDIRLASERDGVDAARELFKELGIRCIFATAHDDPHTRRRAEPYAPLGCQAKPYTMASLVTSVVDALSQLD